jgi:carboxyl-terminal processing protease
MPKRNLAWILVVALIALLFWRMPQTIAGRDELFAAFRPMLDVRNTILKRSAEPVEDSKLSSAAARAGIEAMIRELGDPYILYLDRETYPEFRKQTEGVFGGIGVDVLAVPEGLRVLSRIRGSPAARAGIRPGETIVTIDGLSAADLGLVDGVNRLSGPPGTPVRLEVRDHAGKDRPLRITRETIEINPIRGWSRRPDGSWRYWLDERNHIAYVRLVKFMPSAIRQLDAVVTPLVESGMTGLILDLRENTGGLLRTAIDIADRFLDTGLIVSVRGPKTDAREWSAQHEDSYPPIRVVVLVNRTTASAAEIVAGALRDHRRAVVVGERTYGKGSVQELVPLEDGGTALKLTTGVYYLPSGRCLQKLRGAGPNDQWGVEPDRVVKLDDAQRVRWLEAWYLAGAEPDEEESDAATTRPADAATQPSADDIALEHLLAVDPQLDEALKLLRTPPGSEAPALSGRGLGDGRDSQSAGSRP